jgi:hypothetical protein
MKKQEITIDLVATGPENGSIEGCFINNSFWGNHTQAKGVVLTDDVPLKTQHTDRYTVGDVVKVNKEAFDSKGSIVVEITGIPSSIDGWVGREWNPCAPHNNGNK